MCKIETILYKAFYVLEQFVEMKLVLYSLVLINCILLSKQEKMKPTSVTKYGRLNE